MRAEKPLIELLKAKHPDTLFRPPWFNWEFTPAVALKAIERGTPFGKNLVRAYYDYLCKYHPAYLSAEIPEK